jgi:hypothetical protein
MKKYFISSGLTVEAYEYLSFTWAYMSTTSAAIFLLCAGIFWTMNHARPFSDGWWTLAMATGVSFTTEFRFAIGHWRYIRQVYRRDASWLADARNPSEATFQLNRRVRWDLALSELITVSKVLMSITLAFPQLFLWSFVLLMLCDLLWLWFEPRVAGWRDSTKDSFVPRQWMCRNLITALLILFASQFQYFGGVELCAMVTVVQLIVALINCILDIISSLRGR